MFGPAIKTPGSYRRFRKRREFQNRFRFLRNRINLDTFKSTAKASRLDKAETKPWPLFIDVSKSHDDSLGVVFFVNFDTMQSK